MSLRDRCMAVIGGGGVASLLGLVLAVFQKEYDNGNSGTAATINWNNGNKQMLRLTGSPTLTFVKPVVGGAANFVLRFEFDSDTVRTVTWPSDVVWRGGIAPTVSSDDTLHDVFTFYWNDDKYYGTLGCGFDVGP